MSRTGWEPTPEVLDLLRRLRAADPRDGWPPMAIVLSVVAEFFDDYGLTIDDNPDELEPNVRVLRGKQEGD